MSRVKAAAKVSICITTHNRAAFIAATLESILLQVTDDCEVLVLDAGSTDETEKVVSGYLGRFDQLRYIRQNANNGIDRDYDRVVELATGEYCWMMADDDTLKPEAVSMVLEAVSKDPSVVIVNVELRDIRLSNVVQCRWVNAATDRTYGPEESDRMFTDLGERLWYIGGVIIKRGIWLDRERARYYDSWFIYVGVIFQERLPSAAIFVAKPLICYRLGNPHTFSPRLFEIIWFRWPSLVWSLSLPDSAKSKVSSPEPWRNARELLLYRGLGYYSLTEFRRWIRPRSRSAHQLWVPALIALLPGVLVNAAFVLYYSMTDRPYHGWRKPSMMLHSLTGSRFYYKNVHLLKVS